MLGNNIVLRSFATLVGTTLVVFTEYHLTLEYIVVNNTNTVKVEFIFISSVFCTTQTKCLSHFFKICSGGRAGGNLGLLPGPRQVPRVALPDGGGRGAGAGAHGHLHGAGHLVRQAPGRKADGAPQAVQHPCQHPAPHPRVRGNALGLKLKFQLHHQLHFHL